MKVSKYLSRAQVAERIGVKLDTLTRYKLPPHDAVIGEGRGERKGWLPQTIDVWNAQRPGRGYWGPRPKAKAAS